MENCTDDPVETSLKQAVTKVTLHDPKSGPDNLEREEGNRKSAKEIHHY